MSFLQMPNPIAARRFFLGQSGLVLSGAAVALLAGKHALAAKAGEATAGDAQILNTALGAELEAIAAYQLGAESKLLQKPALDLALASRVITRNMPICSPRRSKSSAASRSRPRRSTTSRSSN